jgi:hypothetical protein
MNGIIQVDVTKTCDYHQWAEGKNHTIACDDHANCVINEDANLNNYFVSAYC